MIVFDLQCSRAHVFEAWFGSSHDYEDQKARGLVACPACGDETVGKAVMAPAVGAKGNRRGQRASNVPAATEGRDVATMTPGDAARLDAMIKEVAKVQARILEKSEWVGTAFADKARAMYYGETPHASIHGVTDAGEARALLEEGVAVAPLPLPVIPPEDRN